MIEINIDNFKQEVTDCCGKALVEFYTPWCAECTALKPIIESVSHKLCNIKFCMFNCDENREFVMDLGIMSIPAIILFENGKEVKRRIGLLDEQEIISMINKS